MGLGLVGGEDEELGDALAGGEGCCDGGIGGEGEGCGGGGWGHGCGGGDCGIEEEEAVGCCVANKGVFGLWTFVHGVAVRG